ncbi:hypothetical protein A7P53_15060 [Acinetobacter defluvii]|uniref:hypothetical protein n=1 Tax=Acinetobacter defluvii TaxID=1871111 RepID=UPI00148FFD2C|nr:hypothetical protein [Acinetobacter defluvii]NNP73903.1 hypothetical protein [Acinetobacter defluvii]
MLTEELKVILTSAGALLSACAAIFMVYYKSKELRDIYRDTLSKNVKSSVGYHDSFYKNKNKYSKVVRDDAAREVAGNQNVDAKLVNLLWEFHEHSLIDFREMMFYFSQGYKYGYLKYEKNEEIISCFKFHFSQKNSKTFKQHVKYIQGRKKLAQIIFHITFWLLMAYTIFFVYLISISTDIFSFIYPLFFATACFLLAFFFPKLSFAMDHTQMFLEKFYAAEERYQITKAEEEARLLEEKNKSKVLNIREYNRSRY